MKVSARRFRFGLVIVLCWGALPALLAAQEAQPKPEQKESEKDSARPRGRGKRDFWQRIGLARAPGEYEKSHDKITAAFRDIVTGPSKSTVRVLSEDAPVALGASVDSEGHILTKASELKGNVVVQLADDRRFHARIVGIDPQHDLAMLKIAAEGLPAVEWVDDVPPPGSWLATPGLDPSSTAIGVVSVAPRKIGAPSAMLGVQLEEDSKGPRVNQVLSGSGAERSGVQVNDVITHVNGDPVKNREALVDTIRKMHSGDTVLLTIKRGGADLALPAVLGVITPGEPDKRRDFQNNLGGSLSTRRDGFPTVLQHDTVLRPADCGGPLVDLDGKTVGINIARAGRVASYAIPTAAIKPLLAELKSGNMAPEVVAKKKMAALQTHLALLKTAETELVKKFAQTEEVWKNAKAAEAAAKQAAEPDSAAIEKLHSETFAAERALAQARAELIKNRAELKRDEAEQAVLEKNITKE